MAEQPHIHVEKTSELRGHTQAVYTLAASLRQGHLLSSGAEGIVAEWNLLTEEGKAILQAPCPVYKILTLPERGILVMGLRNGEVAFADLKSNAMIKRVQTHAGAVFDLMEIQGGKQMLATGEDGKISLWNLETLNCESVLPISTKSVRSLALHSKTGVIAAGSSDNHIYLLTPDLKLLTRWQAHDLSVFRVTWHPEDLTLFSTGRDAHIKSWIFEDSVRPLHAVPAHIYAVNDLVTFSDNGLLISGSMDKSIKIWQPEDLKLLKVINFEKNGCHWNGVNRLFLHEDSLFSCSDDRIIMRWRVDAKEA